LVEAWYKKLKDKKSSEVADNLVYLYTKGDIMLDLVLERKDPKSCSLELKLRERPVFIEKGNKTDLLDYSGIIVPDRQLISDITASDVERNADDYRYVNFIGKSRREDRNDSENFSVQRDNLVEAVHLLFVMIRGYEGRKITHFAGYSNPKEGRNAQVSVTNIDILRRFDSRGMNAIIDSLEMKTLYNTQLDHDKKIILPPMTNGHIITIPKKYLV